MGRKKKYTILISILVFFFVIARYYLNTKQIERYHDCIQLQSEDNGFAVRVFFENQSQIIYPWYDESTGIWEIFLPSYLNLGEEIKCYINSDNIQILNECCENETIILQDREIYELSKGIEEVYTFRLNLSQNVSTLFIETQSGTMEMLEQSKDNEESGYINSVKQDGTIEFSGKIGSISGRGNGSWECEKKPYNLKLVENAALAGLPEAKNWSLLALYYEGDKIHSKLAFDMEKILGSEIVSECTWVDVYFNGKYNGMYLLIESIKDRPELHFQSDGFLLEKDFENRVEDEFFSTKQGEWFVIKSKGTDSVEKISEQVQICENKIYEKMIDEDDIDIQSFVVQFLVNKISMNIDSFQTSSYLYKLDNENKIYLGPCWDYDGAFAEYLHQDKNWVDPQGTIFYAGERLKWYELLYENPVFYKHIVREFEIHLEELDYLVNIQIDEYAQYIADAVKNDNLRWKFTDGKQFRAGSYQTWENDVRYLKYFLNNRLQYLSELWDVDKIEFSWEALQDVHTVNFWFGGQVIESVKIVDGDIISEFPDIEDEANGSWCYVYSGEPYYEVLPVLEDCDLILMNH